MFENCKVKNKIFISSFIFKATYNKIQLFILKQFSNPTKSSIFSTQKPTLFLKKTQSRKVFLNESKRNNCLFVVEGRKHLTEGDGVRQFVRKLAVLRRWSTSNLSICIQKAIGIDNNHRLIVNEN